MTSMASILGQLRENQKEKDGSGVGVAGAEFHFESLSFNADTSLSMLTEDRSSILDDTLPSIFEEDEDEGGDEDEKDGCDLFGERSGSVREVQSHIDSDKSSSEWASQGSGRELVGLGFRGLFYPAGSTKPFDGLGILPHSAGAQVREAGDADEDDQGPSAQFLSEIMRTFTSTPPRFERVKKIWKRENDYA
jgi:hypothetical protein